MLITTSVHDLYTALVYGMCIAVFVCTDTYILYYRVTIAHDATSTGSGDSSPGNGDMKNPFEEDERYESWLKTNRPDVVSKTCTASSPNNTQISEAQQAPIHLHHL